jgi:ABC-type nickel/cobalt efflux system permease component RcnA
MASCPIILKILALCIINPEKRAGLLLVFASATGRQLMAINNSDLNVA